MSRVTTLFAAIIAPAVAYADAGHDRDVLAYPDVAADDGVALERQVLERGSEALPAAAHDVAGVGRDAVHPVVRAVHDELYAPGYGAEPADDEPVAQELVVVRDVLLKALRPVRVVIIAVLPCYDVRPCYNVLYEHYLLEVFVRIDAVRIRAHISASFREKRPEYTTFPPQPQQCRFVNDVLHIRESE